MSVALPPSVLEAPRLTPAGRATLLGAVGVLGIAALCGLPMASAVGATMLGLVVGSWLTTRGGVLAATALGFELDTPEGPSRSRRSALKVQLRIANRGLRPFQALELGLRVTGSPEPAPSVVLDVPGRATGAWVFPLLFPRAGHWRVHGIEVRINGLLGLSTALCYAPGEVSLNVRPRRLPSATTAAILDRRGAARGRSGSQRSGRAGTGTDLRELRDYVPGDNLRSVAWRATARRQKPLVRVFEEETVLRMQLLVDIGPTMRSGAPGHTALDAAVDLCATVAELGVQNRIGLTTFDHRIYGHLKPSGGRAHLQRQLHHLMDLSRVVDDDLTEISDAELLAMVGRFLEVQGGRGLLGSTRLPWRARITRAMADPLGEIYDDGWLYAAVMEYLSAERDRGHAALFAKARPAKNTRSARLRLFCALRGLPIPYRLTGPIDSSERGLVDAIGRSMLPGSADRLVVFTDLRGLQPNGPAIRALRLASARKKRVVVVEMGPHPPRKAVVTALRAARARIVPAGLLPR